MGIHSRCQDFIVSSQNIGESAKLCSVPRMFHKRMQMVERTKQYCTFFQPITEVDFKTKL